jgi:DNA-directed RNA polymerase subunit RPC12/RpoP
MSDPFPPPGFVPAPSSIEGIDIFKPAPVAEEHREVVEFKCPQCGATTAYSIADGGLTCTHCGYYHAPDREIVGKGAQEFEFTRETLDRAAQGWGETRKELECENCGARTSLPEDTLTHTCPFCGSNRVLQRQAPQDILRPRFLVPFAIQPEQCRQIAASWLGSSWMTPNELRQLAAHEGFTAVYLPYWTFDAVTSADWRAEVGHTESERYYDHSDKSWKTRTRTVWRWESGRVRVPYDDLLVAGTEKLSTLLLGQVQDFDLGALTPYDARFLAGMHAQAYDLPLERSWETARETMRERTRLACRAQASTSQIRNFNMSLDFSAEEWRYILLPVYVAAYAYGGERFQVLLNGQSGAIAGQRPVDWTRVWLVVAALLAPGLLLGGLGLVTLLLGGLGVVFGTVGLVLLVIGAVISAVIVQRAMAMDDD